MQPVQLVVHAPRDAGRATCLEFQALVRQRLPRRPRDCFRQLRAPRLRSKLRRKNWRHRSQCKDAQSPVELTLIGSMERHSKTYLVRPGSVSSKVIDAVNVNERNEPLVWCPETMSCAVRDQDSRRMTQRRFSARAERACPTQECDVGCVPQLWQQPHRS